MRPTAWLIAKQLVPEGDHRRGHTTLWCRPATVFGETRLLEITFSTKLLPQTAAVAANPTCRVRAVSGPGFLVFVPDNLKFLESWAGLSLFFPDYID